MFTFNCIYACWNVFDGEIPSHRHDWPLYICCWCLWVFGSIIGKQHGNVQIFTMYKFNSSCMWQKIERKTTSKVNEMYTKCDQMATPPHSMNPSICNDWRAIHVVQHSIKYYLYYLSIVSCSSHTHTISISIYYMLHPITPSPPPPWVIDRLKCQKYADAFRSLPFYFLCITVFFSTSSSSFLLLGK